MCRQKADMERWKEQMKWWLVGAWVSTKQSSIKHLTFPSIYLSNWGANQTPKKSHENWNRWTLKGSKNVRHTGNIQSLPRWPVKWSHSDGRTVINSDRSGLEKWSDGGAWNERTLQSHRETPLLPANLANGKDNDYGEANREGQTAWKKQCNNENMRVPCLDLSRAWSWSPC